jgi:TPR repeat protein
MAADGGWPVRAGFEPEDERTRRALEDLRAVLGQIQARLATAAAGPLHPQTARALILALDELAARVADQEISARETVAELSAALADSHAETTAQLDAALADLAALRRSSEADPGPIRAILVAAAACAALAVTGAGAMVVGRPDALPAMVAAPAGQPATLDLRRGLRPDMPPAVVAGPPAPLRTAVAAPAQAGETYAAVLAALGRGEAAAVARLTGLAQTGDAGAQLHLASLYETGQEGLPRDLAAARLWTRRAAGGGERVAMHNLGLFLMEGEGGPRDTAEAAAWFRRAADRGVVDSQFNLGLLYESGRGVPQNLREAYRWFSIAANAGDVSAREKQVELEARLRPAERSSLDREAAGFRPGAAPPATEGDLIVPPATTLAETQAFLARQGYYVGPADGATSPQLKSAAAAYLRDHPDLVR